MKIVVAMSGGVDSSVAAALLHATGHEVIGISLKLWEHREDGAGHGCCTPEDLRDARRVAETLGFPFYVFNLVEEFAQRVVDPFVDAYLDGRTPNPCVACNNTVKFDTLLRRAKALGADALATGHYARIEGDPPRLLRAADPIKDQSYFLYGLTEETLRFLRFPVGTLDKDEVRDQARRLGLDVAEKPDSQEICFVPDRDHGAFIRDRVAPEELRPGVFVDDRGLVLGSHDGVDRFTIGQRRGLGISGGDRRYVTSIDATSGEVRVGSRDDLFSRGLEAGPVSWLCPPPEDGRRVTVRIRHRHRGSPATVSDDGRGGAVVEFHEAVRAVAPGQAAVFYDGDRVLGGGAIRRALPL